MSKRTTFLDLEDYAPERGPFTQRVAVALEIESPSDFYADITSPDGVTLIDIETLSRRDAAAVMKWIEDEVRDWCADRLDYSDEQRGEAQKDWN